MTEKRLGDREGVTLRGDTRKFLRGSEPVHILTVPVVTQIYIFENFIELCSKPPSKSVFVRTVKSK